MRVKKKTRSISNPISDPILKYNLYPFFHFFKKNKDQLRQNFRIQHF
jgi:hypothetical protein